MYTCTSIYDFFVIGIVIGTFSVSRSIMTLCVSPKIKQIRVYLCVFFYINKNLLKAQLPFSSP